MQYLLVALFIVIALPDAAAIKEVDAEANRIRKNLEENPETQPPPKPAEFNREGQQVYTIGFVGRTQQSYEYAAASSGAYDAAKDLEKEYGIDIQLQFQTPRKILLAEQLVSLQRCLINQTDGIIVNVLNPDGLTREIDYIVSQGIPVLTYDHDAPQSKRFASVRSNDFEIGKMIMREYAKRLGKNGSNVAILTSNIENEHDNDGLAGATSYLSDNQTLSPYDIYSCSESQAAAILLVDRSEIDSRIDKKKIDGWAFLTYWPVFGKEELPWEGGVPCVGVGTLPPMVEHLKSGRVQALVSEAYYDWGYKSVAIMVEKLHLGKQPKKPNVYTDIELITKNNAEQYTQNWEQWTRNSKAFDPERATTYRVLYPTVFSEELPHIYNF